MTALELTIYPKQPSRPGPGKGWADWRRDQDRECRMAHDKRFSDAELAAEYWQANTKCATSFPLPETEWAHAETLHRFATHPHYYEETE